MGYLDYAGLQYLWDKLKEKFAPKSHRHDDRYYTESEMNTKLSKKAKNIVLASDTNLNNITTPGFYSCGGGNKITNKPNNTDAIGLIVTHNASGNYYTQILTTSSSANTYRRTCLNGTWSGWTQDKYTDTNTWRGIQNNLTSDSTSDSLSAAQGKVLKGLVDGKANSFHTHTKSQITDFPASLKNPTALTIQTNGATAATYDGSAAKTVNITKGNIGLGKVDNTADADKTVKRATTAGTADSANSVAWENVKDKPTTFPAEAHNHDDRYYTEAEINSKLSGKVDNTEAGANGLINKLESGTAAPVDNDLIITQWANHTTAAAANQNKYVRRPMSSIWSYIKSKADSVYQPKGSYAASNHSHDDRYYTEAETDGKLNGKSNIGHTHDDRYYTESEMNTKLNEKANANHIHLNGTKSGAVDWNTFITYGVYKIQNCTMSDTYHAPNPEYQFGILQVLDSENNGGEKRIIQIYWPHSTAKGNHLWYRMHNSSDINAGWSGWTQIKKKPDTAGYADSAGSVAWGNISGKPSSYPPASHSHAYLPLGGGTMTGNITFSDIGNTNTSNKISWNGSTDGADIYYQTTAGDQGNLVLNLRDDSNCYLRIAKNGTFKSYFSPDDGNFHGNVNGTADVANVANFAKGTYINQYKTVNLTDLDQNTWYPVTGTSVPYNGLRNFKCNVQLNSGSKPNWSTHGSGFTAVVDILEESSGWGTTGMLGEVLINDQLFIADKSKPPVGYQQMEYGSIPVWWLRGGGTYFLAADYDCTWTIRKSKYENRGQSVAPTITYPGVNVSRATITANLNGNANTAGVATVGVRDYNNANRTIRIGYAGVGLNTSNLTHIAGYTENGTQIKDVSKDVLTSWIGLGNYLPLSGGTMSGQITKSTGGSWIGDRDRAAIKSSYAGDGDYGAVAAMATKNGYWTMGALGGWEDLVFNYSTDSNYSASKNETSQVRLPAQAGTIITSATIGSQSVNYANSAGNGVETSGADYIRFSNGLQICWGDESSGSSSGVNVFFPVPFSATPPYIGFGSIIATQFTPYLKSRSNTFFTWYKEGTTFGKVCWVAIGKWK